MYLQTLLFKDMAHLNINSNQHTEETAMFVMSYANNVTKTLSKKKYKNLWQQCII